MLKKRERQGKFYGGSHIYVVYDSFIITVVSCIYPHIGVKMIKMDMT